MEDVGLEEMGIRMCRNHDHGGQEYLVETLESTAIHAVAVKPYKQVRKRSTVPIHLQIQDVVQNLRHHVQASLKSIEFDFVRRGYSTTRAHILNGEHYESNYQHDRTGKGKITYRQCSVGPGPVNIRRKISSQETHH